MEDQSFSASVEISSIAGYCVACFEVKGSAIGNLTDLFAPLRKHKPGRPTSSRDKPIFDDRALKSSKKKQKENIGEAVGCGSSK